MTVEFAIDDNTMISGAYLADPGIIICPYLKDRVPEAVWRRWPTIIIHPGPVGDRGPSSLDWAIVVSGGNLAMSLDLEQCLSSCPEILSSPAPRGSDAGPSGDVVRCGWVAPVRAPIVSGFRTAERPGHNGVDLGAARGTPIHVASSGTVVVVRCNVVPASHGCDQDGSPSTPGCGWYVDVLHAGQVVTRYCHMLTRPMVAEGQQVLAGQVIGVVGSSGHSSGPHLHFEVHVNGDRSPNGAVDPVGFMQAKGVPLGR